MKKIVLYPDPVLREVCKVVARDDKKVAKEISELVEVLQKTGNGAGLAAPQIGVSKRFFALKNNASNKEVVDMYVNPEILDTFGEKKNYFTTENKKGEVKPFLEGCLSIPEIYGEVKRWDKLKIKRENLKNEIIEEVLEGYTAIVFQHELDHLDGILFVDHVKAGGKKLLKEIKDEMVEISFDMLNLKD